MSEDLKLGEIIEADREVHRDAIHIAVVPVYAGEALHAGAKVRRASNSTDTLVYCRSDQEHNSIGVVDPFLIENIKAGDKFWLYLNPGSITSLRHEWTHPDFPATDHNAVIGVVADTKASEQWLRDFIDMHSCPDYETLINAVLGDHEKNERPDDNYYGSSSDGESLHFNGYDAHGEIPDEFWHHVEVVTGRTIKQKPKYFSCSC